MQEAFEPICKQEITLESLTQAINRLLMLKFLPAFKGLNASYEIEELKNAADKFPELEPSLQEATFDCVIAISRISMHIRNDVYAHDQTR